MSPTDAMIPSSRLTPADWLDGGSTLCFLYATVDRGNSLFDLAAAASAAAETPPGMQPAS